MILAGDGPPHRQIPRQCVLARLVQVYHANLVAFAQHPQRVVLNIGDVQANQLGNTQPAVQEQRQNTVIPLPVRPIHRVQQGKALVQRQVAGEGLHLLGRVHVLAGIVLQQVTFVADIVEKGADRGQLPRTGGRVQTFVRIFTMLVLHTFSAEIRHVAVDVRQRDGTQKGQVDVPDVDGVQGLVRQRRIADLFHVAEEIPHIQVVFVHRPLGVRFDGLVVAEEIQQQLRRV